MARNTVIPSKQSAVSSGLKKFHELESQIAEKIN